MKKLFIFGFLIKLLAIFFALHNDLIFVWGIPAYFIENANLLGSYYGPLTYVTFGILSPIYFLSQNVGYWILKIPYLLVDLFILDTLLKLNPNKLHKNLMLFWWLNPVVIFSTYMLGQFDIIMAGCVIFSAYASRDKITSVVSLGVGIAYKTLTLSLLPTAAFTLETKLFQRIKLLFWGIIVGVIPGLIFYLFTKGDIISAYFPKGVVFYPKLSTSPDSIWEYSSLVVGIIGYFYIQAKLFLNKYEPKFLSNTLYASLAFVLILLPLYSLHRYTIIIPLLVLIAVKYKKTVTLLVILITLFLGYVYAWRLQWGLIDHIYPVVKTFPALREWVAPVVNYENVALLFRITADSLIIYLAFISFNKISRVKSGKVV